ncbi:group III truncated hemoglobin [Caulobacter segnis]|uniref:group III truncated hemoglobin n=1 Tax=Caulobacter segnis TaxID=88688 RepID=UPI00240EDEFA|nr:group III truncated hemoglobin [Caulobacter segnis]MDG2520694.1 group III truncated hemoglobin [Caulobacter segnis]
MHMIMTAPALQPDPEDQLPALMERLYARAREDEALGPVFSGAIEDWPHHLGVPADFWSSVMLTTGRFKGNPMAARFKHAKPIERRCSNAGSPFGSSPRRSR